MPNGRPPLGRWRRRVDRRLYRWMFRAERALFPAGPRPAAIRRVLVVASHRVGDLVVLGPTLSYLRARLPDAAIDVAASAANASLLAGDPRLRAVVRREPTRAGWWRAALALRRHRYDLVLSTKVLSHLSEGLFAALVAPRGAVRASAWRPRRYAGFFTCPIRVPPRHAHVVDRLLYAARTALGDPAEAPGGAPLPVPPAALPADAAADARAARFVYDAGGGRPVVAFTAWGSDPKRCFGVEVAAEIVAGIAARHPELVVAITPAPAAVGEAEAIAQAARARLAGARDAGATESRVTESRVVVAPASADLRDLVALIRHAAAVVSPDTANMHIAAAVGTPYVAVYSAYTAVALWGAWGGPRRVVYADDRRPIREIPVDAVIAGFEALWAEVGGRRGA
ncbi:hypothetical protein tb265_30700 [Gemmatimonadetes bacterium T265]|nr:hypothetical protein tb265_30700 [Gemmatimonadetes bacterium T265]